MIELRSQDYSTRTSSDVLTGRASDPSANLVGDIKNKFILAGFDFVYDSDRNEIKEQAAVYYPYTQGEGRIMYYCPIFSIRQDIQGRLECGCYTPDGMKTLYKPKGTQLLVAKDKLKWFMPKLRFAEGDYVRVKARIPNKHSFPYWTENHSRFIGVPTKVIEISNNAYILENDIAINWRDDWIMASTKDEYDERDSFLLKKLLVASAKKYAAEQKVITLKEYQQVVATACFQVSEAYNRYMSFCFQEKSGNLDEGASVFARSIKNIREHEKCENLDIEANGNVTISTGAMRIDQNHVAYKKNNFQYPAEMYEMGKYKMEFSLNKRRFHVTRVDDAFHGGHYHPHIEARRPSGAGTNICLGNMSSDFQRAMSSLDLYRMYLIACAIIESYNHNSPYTKLHDYHRIDAEWDETVVYSQVTRKKYHIDDLTFDSERNIWLDPEGNSMTQQISI